MASSLPTRTPGWPAALVVCAIGFQACTDASAAMTADAATARAQALLQPGQPAAQQANASPGDTFIARRSEVLKPDQAGQFHIRFDRAYQGVPVDGGDIIVHLMPDGVLSGVTTSLSTPLKLPTVTPRMARNDALAQGLAAFRKKGRDDSSSVELRVAAASHIAAAPALVWRVEVQGSYCNHPSRMQYWFDAQSSRLISQHDEQESAVPMTCN